MSVERVGPDAVAWTFTDAVINPGSMSDLRVNGQGPAELVDWAGARLVVRYDAIDDPATWEAAAAARDSRGGRAYFRPPLISGSIGIASSTYDVVAMPPLRVQVEPPNPNA